MSNKKETETEGVIKKALSPASEEFGIKSKEAGAILGEITVDIARTARAILLPVKGLVWGIEKFQNEFAPLLVSKVSEIPPEKRIEPSLEIIGPCIETLKYHGYKEEIKELIANLMSSSMNKDYIKYAHPSFVALINQISSDEAKILKALSKHSQISWQIISPRIINEGLKIEIDRKDLTYDGFDYFCKKIGLEHPDLFYSYIENLDRLQLVRATELGTFISKTYPKNPEAQEAIKKIKDIELSYESEINEWSITTGKSYDAEARQYFPGKFSLLSQKSNGFIATSYGEKFMTACFIDEQL